MNQNLKACPETSRYAANHGSQNRLIINLYLERFIISLKMAPLWRYDLCRRQQQLSEKRPAYRLVNVNSFKKQALLRRHPNAKLGFLKFIASVSVSIFVSVRSTSLCCPGYVAWRSKSVVFFSSFQTSRCLEPTKLRNSLQFWSPPLRVPWIALSWPT